MDYLNANDLQYNKKTETEQLSSSELSFEKIMNDYGTEIKRLVYSYLKNNSDAEDVTQDVFVTVYQKWNTFRGQSTIRSWIYSIAINKSKDHLRSWKGRSHKLNEKLRRFKASSENQVTPEDQLIEKNSNNLLLNQVMSLPIKYREVIILHYFKEFSVKEIAETLSTKETTIRTRLNRGRNKIKDLIQSERGEEVWKRN
ncbi:sigma-70 family RNA polymerase sigma factor [Gracilibacillus sp. YIM 98692]|uniref:sigma-70 family RNA polymerase sigma factor n=1 Tax=Gracilibacillus sp. YIM 98692 TaxID=2663532 RepID=UPI001F092E6A|nr:sigma-70 family RNA polymerase sigma factor [Gracilibacillus sp. YIM 98692]